MLVEMGGDIEGTDEFGRTRLIQAVISGHEKTAKVFISIFDSPLISFIWKLQPYSLPFSLNISSSASF